MALLQIPGNVKQGLIPFVLNPQAYINNPLVESSEKLQWESPQIFSFRPHEDFHSYSAFGELGFYPNASNVVDQQMDKDLSFQSLYSMDSDNNITKKPLTFNAILSRLPCVSIREFIPDPRLNQAWNLLTSFLSPLADLKDVIKTIWNSNKSWELTKHAVEYITGLSEPNMWNDKNAETSVFDEVRNYPFSSYDIDYLQSDDVGKKRIKYVMNFPYFMYYKLQSCTTTNIYEIPAISENKTIITSKGSTGWDDFGAFGISEIDWFPKSKWISGILGEVGVNYMPFWDAARAKKQGGDEINVKFDLFNDNLDFAITNFIFVNTIAPNNKWIQYHILAHSSSLYDIKIEGVNRLFACTGDVEITYGGILRDPSMAFIEELKSHMNNAIAKEVMIDNIIKNKMIKIPDVYHVNLRFKSLFPANFNNFLYVYAQNINHIEQYGDNAFVPGDGDVSSVFGKKLEALEEYLKSFASGSDSTPNDDMSKQYEEMEAPS